MSVVLLVELDVWPYLYRVNTQAKDAEGNPVVPFKAWKDRNGIDLYWMGRRVCRVYAMNDSAEVWRLVCIPDAANALLRQGVCVKVSSEPSPEGELPS